MYIHQNKVLDWKELSQKHMTTERESSFKIVLGHLQEYVHVEKLDNNWNQ